MTKTYTLSYLHKIRTPILVRRPWWNLFGKDRIEFVENWNRRVIPDLTKAEADILIHATYCYWNLPIATLILKLLGEPTLDRMQLEGTTKASANIPTAMKETQS